MEMNKCQEEQNKEQFIAKLSWNGIQPKVFLKGCDVSLIETC